MKFVKASNEAKQSSGKMMPGAKVFQEFCLEVFLLIDLLADSTGLLQAASDPIQSLHAPPSHTLVASDCASVFCEDRELGGLA